MQFGLWTAKISLSGVVKMFLSGLYNLPRTQLSRDLWCVNIESVILLCLWLPKPRTVFFSAPRVLVVARAGTLGACLEAGQCADSYEQCNLDTL